MKILDIRLLNYKRIYSGTKRKELYIDLRKCKNKILLIKGRNGGGKSALLNAMSPFPDSNDSFLDGENAEKEITYLHGNAKYNILFQHNVSVSGDRSTVKAYMKKINDDGILELNPTGSVTVYKSVLETEFGLDSNFISLSRLSVEDRGIVDKTPSERIKYVMNILNDVEVYNNMLKVLTKRESIYKSMANSISSKIANIGNEGNLESKLVFANNKISDIDKEIDKLRNSIADSTATINVLDPGGSIQHSYKQTADEYNSIISLINSNDKALLDLYKQCTFIDQSYNDIDKANSEYTRNFNQMKQLFMEINNEKEKVNDSILERDEESKIIQIKISKMNALKSEFNFIDIQNTIKEYTERIKYCESVFSDIGIKNAISISKDEYINAINVFNSIKDTISVVRSSTDYVSIQTAINVYHGQSGNIGSEIYNLEQELSEVSKQLEISNRDISYFGGMIESLAILKNRPDDCYIDSCPFISNAVNIKKKNPELFLSKAKENFNNYEAKQKELLNRLSSLRSVYECLRNLSMINKSIDNSRHILNKFPNGYIFTDQNEFYRRMLSSDNFNEIDQLLDNIQYANLFEEYKLDKDTLSKLNSEYKVYESKNEIIEELSKDIDSVRNNIDKITEKITDIYSVLKSKTDEYDICKGIVEEINKTIHIINENKSLKLKSETLYSTLSKLSKNMSMINEHLSYIDNNKNMISSLTAARSPLEKERDSIIYSLRLLKNYSEELKEYSESYNLISTLKQYANPSKKGIQQLFIKIYMRQTISLSNTLLSQMFNGRLEIYKPIIDSGKFSIPCYSHESGMTMDDISSCSTSEKCMMSMIIGMALLKQSSTMYNVLRLDEIDSGLDSENRIVFIKILYLLIDLLEVEQTIIISHSIEMDIGSVDIIQLAPTSSGLEAEEGNVIFKL